MIYDLIIVGMGPGGMSAAIYANRSGMNVLVFEKDTPGGLINKTTNVDNYLGFNDIVGPELSEHMFKHFSGSKIPYLIEEVKKITIDGEIKNVITNKNVYRAYSVIIASGRKNKKLQVENAIELEGKGISYCVLCDGKLHTNKNVAIIGAGNSAFEEGVYLTKICRKIYIINKFNKLTADDVLVDQMTASGKMEIINNVQIEKLYTNETGFLSGLKLTNGRELEISGLFVYVGFEQASEMVDGLNVTNELGYIKVDNNQETIIKGLFACGDITQKKIYQIITAASEGAVAAINANRHIDLIKKDKK